VETKCLPFVPGLLAICRPHVSAQQRSQKRRLKQRLLLHAPGLTPTAVLAKLAEIKMIDVWIPTVDQRWLILPRYTQPSVDTKLLIEKLKLQLPSQPPPRLVAQRGVTKSRYTAR
jgi:hypothetical protein